MVVGDVATGTDVLVIGGGPGGYVAAIRAAQGGKDVVLVEKNALGGVCLNVGCIPSKALISAAEAYHGLAKEAQRGLQVESAAMDVKQLQTWKGGMVQRLTDGIGRLLQANDVQVVNGKARFTDDRTVMVETDGGSEVYSFEHAIIATGSRPVELPPFPFDGEHILSSSHALSLEEAPEHLVVIGGGYIGLELGMVYARLGSRVTVVEMMDQLIPGTNPELVQVVARNLRRLKVKVHLNTRALEWKEAGDGEGVSLTLQELDGGGAAKGDPFTVAADKVLVSVGRRPNSEDLGLDRAGVAVDHRGFITVDDERRTSVPHIFAIGDVAGEPMLAHKASREGIVAAEVIIGEPAAYDPVSVPAVIFTDPEIAYVGLSEDQAKEQGYDVTVGRFPLMALGRALTMGQTDGYVKLIAEAESGVLLGAEMVGPEASNLISEVTLALEMGARLEDIAGTIHPHPTLGEAWMEAALVAMGTPIHIAAPPKR